MRLCDLTYPRLNRAAARAKAGLVIGPRTERSAEQSIVDDFVSMPCRGYRSLLPGGGICLRRFLRSGTVNGPAAEIEAHERKDSS